MSLYHIDHLVWQRIHTKSGKLAHFYSSGIQRTCSYCGVTCPFTLTTSLIGLPLHPRWHLRSYHTSYRYSFWLWLTPIGWSDKRLAVKINTFIFQRILYAFYIHIQKLQYTRIKSNCVIGSLCNSWLGGYHIVGECYSSGGHCLQNLR